jgi:hypothetical protein
MSWDEAFGIRDDESWQDPMEAIRVHQWLLGRPQPQASTFAGEAVRFHRKSLAAVGASAAERTRLVNAVNALVTANASDPSRWGKFADIHGTVMLDIHGTFTNGDPARSWPGLGSTPVAPPPTSHRMWAPLMQFLPWHRMFVRWFEQELQLAARDPNVFIPYWDWTTQRALPSWVLALNATIVTPSGRSIPVDRTTAAKSGASGASGGPRDFGSMPSAADVSGATNLTSYSDMTGELEMQHNRPHVWVGDGFALGDLSTSPADFVFFLHHTNIDRIWAQWQASREAAAVMASIAGAVGGAIPLGGPIMGLGGAAMAAWIRSQAAHPQPSMALVLPAGMAAPTIAGRTLSTAGSVENTADLEYDYI